jgi:hypothetical protein
VDNSENTGGAHPNDSLDGLTWDKASGQVVSQAALFRPGADMAGADTALCQAIRAAKRARTGDEDLSGELTACPALEAVSVTLAPSTITGRAGGLTALFSAYQLGPYAEGDYEIAVPQRAFRTALAGEYLGEFDGEPKVAAKK